MACGTFRGKCSADFSGQCNTWLGRNAGNDPGGPLHPVFVCDYIGVNLFSKT